MEKNSGLHSLLSSSSVYNFFQSMIGSDATRRQVVTRFIHPRPGDRVLDIGCGTGEWYPLLGPVDYIGFDAYSPYIETARNRYPSGKFVCARVEAGATQFWSQCDIVIAIGVLHHLSNHESSSLIEIAADALKPGGRLITLDPCFDVRQGFASRWIIGCDRGKNVRTVAGYQELAKSHFSKIAPTLWLNPLRIPYTYCILECAK